jgi:hypothetical protein
MIGVGKGKGTGRGPISRNSSPLVINGRGRYIGIDPVLPTDRMY